MRMHEMSAGNAQMFVVRWLTLATVLLGAGMAVSCGGDDDASSGSEVAPALEDVVVVSDGQTATLTARVVLAEGDVDRVTDAEAEANGVCGKGLKDGR